MSRNTNIEYFTNSVRPELDGTTSHPTRLSKNASQVVGYVEGHSGGHSGRFGKGFDRLSPNGMYIGRAGDLI
ncbi:hypothetical protein GALL_100680 [mine drainage metagenome]|uniref:Uncharacterized protein n=1 Tax=mine drainage metagenome TaxID=410659 RepID=A0A1J5SHC3_9ZZZZ